MWGAAGELAITFNGEICNFAKLRRELEGVRAVFRMHGETEVILAACRQWEDGCVERFNGMFAFTLYDT